MLRTARTCPYAPPAEHVRLREQEPVARVVLPSGTTAWALSRFEDIRAMLSDRRFSCDRQDPGFPHFFSGRRVTSTPGRTLIALDPPEHTAVRRGVVGEFTLRRMALLRPRIQQIVDERIDAMLAGPRPADLVRALSLPVPSLAICELLGVPYTDHELFQHHSGKLVRRSVPKPERNEAFAALHSYIRDLVTQKEKSPGDDLLSRQIAQSADREDVVNLGFLLLLAGHETTANMISLGVMALLDDPARGSALRADPDLTPPAVEELLRYFTIAEFVTSRVAKADVEIGGVLIRAGEGAIALSNAANRDPAAFSDGDRLDFSRDARHHLAFGYGPHQCLGQNLARLELQIVLDTLLRRVPGLRLAVPVEALPFKDDAAIYGLYELPVTWDPEE